MNLALIVAGGRGSRAKANADKGVAKQYCMVKNRPLLSYSLERFLNHSSIDAVAVVIHGDDRALYDEVVNGNINGIKSSKLLQPIIGGTSRQSSVHNGLKQIKHLSPTKVFIHDAARPCLRAKLIDELIAASDAHKGVIPSLPVTDTIKRVSGQLIDKTIDRANLRTAQTPQLFDYEFILGAHTKAAQASDTLFTDDASIAEWLNEDITYIDGALDNLKVTNERDFGLAAYYLSQ